MAELDNDGEDLSITDILQRANDSQQENLHTATSGRIEAFYDAASPGHGAQTADITPMVTRRIPLRDGTFTSERMPTLRGVPLMFLGAGGWFIRFPIKQGDTVLLIFAERDLAWWRQTGEVSDPLDIRHHHLAHAIALPGLRSRPGALPAQTGGDALELGHTSGSTIRIEEDGTIRLGGTSAVHKAADATLVHAELLKIQTTLASLAGATFVTPYPPLSDDGIVQSVEATKVTVL